MRLKPFLSDVARFLSNPRIIRRQAAALASANKKLSELSDQVEQLQHDADCVALRSVQKAMQEQLPFAYKIGYADAKANRRDRSNELFGE